MENLTQNWADKYGSVWIVCGPVFTASNPKLIGAPGEMKIPVPNAFYKIVIREDAGKVSILPFLYPHIKIVKINKRYRQEDYLTSVDAIEKQTGLDFLSILDDVEEDTKEAQTPETLWK